MMKESLTERLNRYRSTLEEMKRQRKPHEPGWKDISRLLMHANGLYDGEKPGEYVPRKSEALDSRPRKYLGNFAAMMHAGLTSPARPWFKLTTEDPDLIKYGPIRDWVSRVEAQMYQAYRKSNFYSSVHSGYLELTGFGIQCCFLEESFETLLHFCPQTIGTYWIAQNDYGMVDTVYRTFAMTARTMARRFGKENLSTVVQAALERNELQFFRVFHVTEPRERFDPRKKDKYNKPFVSCYFEEGTQDAVLREGGFDEFPYLTARWETLGNDPWGNSPGADVLPDIKQLTAVIRTQTTAIHKELDPPMAMGGTMKDRLNLMPGTQHPGMLNPQGELLTKPIYSPNPNLQHGVELRNDIRDAIQAGFFNDLFIFMLQRKDITATEVAERHEEKLLMLGPAIERQQSEFFNPLADRTFGILIRNGFIPPPPEAIQDQELKVEYISLLAQAQKIVGINSVDSMVQFTGNMSQIWPDAIDKINPDMAIDIRADLIGADLRMINAASVVNKTRQARADAQQAAQMNEAMMNAAEAGKTMSETKINPEQRTALTDAAEVMAGGALQ
jgi:hypothetical protein